MKIGGMIVILVLFGGGAAGTWRAGFGVGAAVLAGMGVVCLLLYRAGSR